MYNAGNAYYLLCACIIGSVMLCMSACGSSNVIDAQHMASSSITATDVTSAAAASDPALEMTISECDGLTVVTLTTAQSMERDQILYEMEYDPEQYSLQSATLGDCLGGEDECVSAVFGQIPGEVSLGQVRMGLTKLPLEAGVEFATLELSPGPSRLTSVVDYESLGLKLRSNLEFTQADVPFNVSCSGNNIYFLTWEEANDGDYSRDGVVNVSDLTPIGQYYGDGFTENQEFYENAAETHWEMNRAGGSAVANSSIKGISTKSTLPPGGNEYAPVLKHQNGGNSDAPTVHDESLSPWYLVDVGDLTLIGQNWKHQVKGYRIYAVNTPTPDPLDPPVAPIPSNIIDDPILLKEVSRPADLDMTTLALGLGFWCGDPAYTYRTYCMEQFSGDYERNGLEPVETEPRMFKTCVLLPEMQGDTYLVVTPDPGFEGTTLGATDLGAYTYWPEPLSTVSLEEPDSITWLNGKTGIQEIQRGGTANWPEGTEHQFRISIGEAEMGNHAYYEALGWEVRYTVFISRTASALWDTDDDLLPVHHSYPSNSNPRQAVIDLAHPGGWLDFVPNPGEADTTFYVGVRAYPYKQYTESFESKLTDLDSNTQSDSVTLGPAPTPPEDESMPHNPVMEYSTSTFIPAWVLSDEYTSWTNPETGVTWSGYKALPLFRGHPENSSAAGSENYFNPCSWMRHSIRKNSLADEDEYGDPRDLGDLQYRVEYFRTTMDKEAMQAEIDSAGGTVPWLRANTGIGDVYSVSMSFPGLPTFGYLQNSNIDQWTWHNEQRSLDVINTHPSPPYPWCGLLGSDSELYTYYKSMNPNFEFSPYQGNIGTDLWAIGNSDWGLFNPPSVIKCEGDFYNYPGDMVRFVYDPAYEQDYNSQAYNYFSVAAVNDPEDNCSYSNSIMWHGPVSQLGMDAYGIFTEQEYEKEYNVSLGDVIESDGFFKSTSTPDSTSAAARQARYPDLAYDPVRDVLGVSLYDPNNGWCTLHELYLTLNAGIVQRVDSASYGDTSLAYDSSGNPHVAYYRITDTSGEPVEQGLVGLSGTSSIKTSSTGYLGGIKYKTRSAGTWSPAENVDERPFINSSEHGIHFDGTGDPFCIIPTSDNAQELWNLGIPGYSEPGTGVDWSVAPLGTPEVRTDMMLDSIVEVDGQNTSTYVAYYSAVSNSLHLGVYINQSAWVTHLLDSGDVQGYPAIARMPNGNLGFSYMVGEDNRLRYGEWDGVSFEPLYESEVGECGYQSVISYDTLGKPIIYSLSNQCTVLETRHTGSQWAQFGVGLAETSDLLAENTLSVARVGDGDWLAFIGSMGTLQLIYLPYV